MIFLDNTKNQPSKVRTRNWVEINDDSRETYNTGNGIRFKNSMLKSSLCDYSDAYISVKGKQQLLEEMLTQQWNMSIKVIMK